MSVVGVDGCPEGRVAIEYEGAAFAGARVHGDIRGRRA